MDRGEDAVNAYRQAIRLKPDFAKAYFNLGLLYAELRRYEEAIEAYRQTIRLTPDNADAHSNLGMLYGGTNRPNEAKATLKEAIKLAPDSAAAHYNLGLVYIQYGDISAACEQQQRLLRLDRKLADTLAGLIKRVAAPK